MKAKKLFSLALGLAVLLPAAELSAQNELALKLLAQSGSGVLTLTVFDKDKKEIGRGAAVVLSPTTAATTYHLVSKAADVKALDIKKKKISVEGVLAVDKTLDLALLQIKGKAAMLPAGPALAPDLTVVAMGSDKLGETAAAEGKIQKLFEAVPGVTVASSTMVLKDEFDGGAVLDESGKLVGLLNLSDLRLRYIVPTAALTALRPGTLVPFKNRTPEDFRETLEFAWLAGRLYLWLDIGRSAVQNLEKVTKAQPDNVEAWKLLASVYEGQRDYTKAAGTYEQLTKLNPGDARAFAGLGRILSRMKKDFEDTSNLGRAAENLEKAVALDPTLYDAYQDLGNCYEGLREWAKAGDAYEKFLSSNPSNPVQALKMLGNVRREAGQFEQASAVYAEVVKYNPEDTYLNYQYAQMLEKAKKYDEAEAAYIRTGEISKEPGKYMPNIVGMYDGAGLTDKAIAACKKMVEMAPDNEQSHYNLGLQYQKTQKNAEAIAAFQKAVEIKPTFEYAWFQLGSSYYNLKNYPKAIEAFKKNTELVPDQLYGWMYLGMSHMQIKQFGPAHDAMKKAVEIKPDNTDALFNLGIIYLNLKDKFSAQEIVKTLQGLDPAKAAKLKSYIK